MTQLSYMQYISEGKLPPLMDDISYICWASDNVSITINSTPNAKYA